MNQTQLSIDFLEGVANQLRILSIEATTVAGSGHPTSCCSAADVVAALFFGQMRFDPKNPKAENNDRFVLSKGHAAPLLYAAWGESGHVSRQQLMSLRKLDSDFEGHPTPRLDFVDVATGSLGQGLTAGMGMAINAKIENLDYRTYVLLGDGECAEGSVWEAASLAGIRRLNNLVAIVDCNRLGQSQPTAFGHNVEIYRKRFEAFGWHAVSLDGHNIRQILNELKAARESNLPCALIAETIKGKGIPVAEDKEGWHGKPLNKEQAQEAIKYLSRNTKSGREIEIPKPTAVKTELGKGPGNSTAMGKLESPTYYPEGRKVSTRKAFGNALKRVGKANSKIIALDGDVENSTFTQEFGKDFPDRFIECYIAEQNIIGVSVGLSSRGKIPVASTFAAFFTRAFDQIRMGAMSFANLKLCGTHCGVSIGEDGGSQMGLEDLAMMRTIHGSHIFYPCDAMSTERCFEKMIELPGICYLRASRPDTPLLYSLEETFEPGGAKILRQSERDQVTVLAAGVTVFEALAAADLLKKDGIFIKVIDCYSIKPLATELIRDSALKTEGKVITVEDHFPEGGLGDAVAGELSSQGVRVHKLAIRELPHSGTGVELLEKYGIDSKGIIKKVLELI